VTSGGGDFEVTMEELRLVARFAAESAEELLPRFEEVAPADGRPRAAIAAAWEFVHGAKRSNLLRTTSLAAHRAAKEAATESARHAARAAGDAASAAYLHPIAKATQVGHILRAAASAARVAELEAGGDPAAATASLVRARDRATPSLVDVLRRYPAAPESGGRITQLVAELDALLRQGT
jgi:hypothetical protein